MRLLHLKKIEDERAQTNHEYLRFAKKMHKIFWRVKNILHGYMYKLQWLEIYRNHSDNKVIFKDKLTPSLQKFKTEVF